MFLPQSVLRRPAPTFALLTKSVSSCWASCLSGATLLTFFLKEQVGAEKVSLVITLSLFAR